MALAVTKSTAESHTQHSVFYRSGTRTAADFEVDLGFTPSKVTVTNLTDRTSATWYKPLGDAKQVKVVAAGTVTYADCGLSVTNDRVLEVDVSVASLETDDDEVLIEAWG